MFLFGRIGPKFISRTLHEKIKNTMHSSLVKGKHSEARSLVGVVQMTSTSDKESNFRQLSHLVEKAHKQGVKMVFLPECCDYIAESTEQTISLAEMPNGKMLDKFKELSKEFNMWISIGSLHKKIPKGDTKSQIYNTNIILNSEGDVVSEYNKIHLFDYISSDPSSRSLMESSYTQAGDEVVPPIDTPVGKLGQCICYDLRFPEMSTHLREMGAELIAYPSAFTVPTGTAHWEVLLRSRAIETQCYVLAPAQVGQHNHKRTSYGHAMIVDPWGKVVAECLAGEPDLCVAEIDLVSLCKIRKNMPVLNHRRKDLYGPNVNHPHSLLINSKEFYDFGEHKIKNSMVFFSSLHSFAFVNISPVVPGHVLVASRRSVARLKDLTNQEVNDIFGTVQIVSRAIESLFGASSLTVSIQDGEEAGQTVKHLHIHVLPRKSGDFEKNDDIYMKLEKHDKDEKRSKRSEDVMEAEAKLIKDAIENYL